MHRRTGRRGRTPRGFTMVELLIAGLMSALVLLTVYFVFITNSTQYYKQEQLVQLQESMRFATELLKTDLRNAGRLAIVKGEQPQRDPQLCIERAGLRAVELFERDQDTPAVLTRFRNFLRPDRLRLLTDSGSAVMLSTRRIRSDQVILKAAADQPTADARSIARSQSRFEAMFQAGMYLSISTNDFVDFVPINDVAFDIAGSTLVLGEPLCRQVRLAASGLVTSAQLVEYAVAVSADDDERTDLVRRVIDARDGETELNDMTLTVAEYVVNLQVWGVFGGIRGEVPGPLTENAPEDEAGAERLAQNVHRLRGLGVLVSARTPREDEELKIAPDREDAEADRFAADRRWFELDDTPETGYAWVATLIAEVEATNAYRGAIDEP